tara:strand:+ start:2834 stop:4906 length:2073 start_codon:yes stop_codon:yes gene_type:complete
MAEQRIDLKVSVEGASQSNDATQNLNKSLARLIQLQEQTNKSINKVVGGQRKRTSSTKKVTSATKKGTTQNKKYVTSLRNMASSIAVVDGPLGGVASRINAIGTILGRVSPKMLIATAGFVAMGAAIKGIVTASLALEGPMNRLNASLKVTGRDASTSSAELDQFAISLGKATLTSREETLSALSVVSTFSGVATEEMKRVVTVAQDISAVFGTNLVASSRLVARALNEPTKAIETLRRIGITFTSDQKDQIDAMVAFGDSAGATAIILGKLETRFEGLAKADAQGLAGDLDTLGETFTNLGVSLGESGIITVFSKLVKVITNSVDGIVIIKDSLKEVVGDMEKLRQSAPPEDSILSFMFSGTNRSQKIEETKKLIVRQKELTKLALEANKATGGNSAGRRFSSGKKFIEEKAAEGPTLAEKSVSTLKRESDALRVIAVEAERGGQKAVDLQKEIIKVSKQFEKLAKFSISSLSGEKLESVKSTVREIAEINIELTERTTTALDGFKKKAQEAVDAQKRLNDIAGEFGDTVASSFERAIFEGEGLRSTISALAMDLAKLTLRRGVLEPLSGAIAGSSGVTGLMASMFGGAFAKGGNPPMNKVSLVGEQGPELFVPKTAGTIVPNNKMGSAGGGNNSFSNVVNVTVQGGDNSEGTGDEIGQKVRMALKSMVQSQIRDATRLGGSLNKGRSI